MFYSSKNIRIRVSGAIFDDENRVLLIQHKKKGKMYWLFPGGGVEFGETLKEALEREVFEELNLQVEVDDILFLSDSIEPYGKRQILNICFSCTQKAGEIAIAKEKRLNDFKFFSIDELKDIIVFPPFEEKFIKILHSKSSCEPQIYLGAKWLEL